MADRRRPGFRTVNGSVLRFFSSDYSRPLPGPVSLKVLTYNVGDDWPARAGWPTSWGGRRPSWQRVHVSGAAAIGFSGQGVLSHFAIRSEPELHVYARRRELRIVAELGGTTLQAGLDALALAQPASLAGDFNMTPPPGVRALGRRRCSCGRRSKTARFQFKRAHYS
jgi:hypothetical protein